MTILNTANVVYYDSRGNAFDLMVKDVRRIKTASFHEYEWTKEVTDKRFGERLRAWGKDAKTYPVTILFEGANREELLNDLHDALEYDIINTSPGVLVWNDYYIECYGISSKTYPDSNDKLATANDISFYCPSPWWKKITYTQSITPASATGEEVENPDEKTITENVSLTNNRVKFADNTRSFAVILSADNTEVQSFTSLIAPNNVSLDVSTSRFYPYPSDVNRCYATVNMEEDAYAVIINCDSNLFYSLDSITVNGDSVDISNSHIYSYALPNGAAAQTMTYVTLPDGYEGEDATVVYETISTVFPDSSDDTPDSLTEDDDYSDDDIPGEDLPDAEGPTYVTVTNTETVTVPSTKNHFSRSSSEFAGKVLIATYKTSNIESLSNVFHFYNDNALGSKYIITIDGGSPAVVNPTIIIRNDDTDNYTTVNINVEINTNEQLVIDSSNKTVMLNKYDANDELIDSVNYFGARNPNYYLWNLIEGGNNTISWDDDFTFLLELIEERSEPKWLTD